MNITLTGTIEEFVNKKVREGLYEDGSDFVRDAIRQIEKRDRGSFHVLGNTLGADDATLAFLVLVQATESAQSDLQAVMSEVKAITTAKAALRSLIQKVNKDVAANAGLTDGQPPLDFCSGMGNEAAYHHIQIPVLDTGSAGGLKYITTDVFKETISDVAQLRTIEDELRCQLDSMSELGEMESLRLQMAMDRISKLMSTLSSILKKIDDTSQSIAQNLK